MTHGLDIEAIGIEDEGGIVVGAVLRAKAGATGLLAASVFHYGAFRVAEAKAALAAAGLPIRPVPPVQEAA